MGIIRKKMRGKDIKKTAGRSWLYMDNGVHIFTSGHITPSKSEAIYITLASLTEELYETAVAVY